MVIFSAEAGGFEPPVRLPVRQFSKLVVSATHPNFLPILRFLADSNRRTRFCRPLTKPLIQGTIISFFRCIVCFSIAVAKVRLFFESASVLVIFFDKIVIFFVFAWFSTGATSARTTFTRTLSRLYPFETEHNTMNCPHNTYEKDNSKYNFLSAHNFSSK